jgi:arginase family enzyme
VHLDIDVFRHDDLPAAYFPHADGLSLSEGRTLLRTLLADPRVAIVEIAEYAALRDHDHTSVTRVADLVGESLRPHPAGAVR